MAQTDQEELMPEVNDPKNAEGYIKPTKHQYSGKSVHPAFTPKLVVMDPGEAAKKLEDDLGVRPDELARIRAAREEKDREDSTN